MTERIIETLADVEEGAEALAALCPRLGAARALCGDLPLRRKPEGFAELLSAIVSQQVSVASAAGIWARMQAAGAVTPEAVRALDDEGLRALGLSRPKVRYARALAVSGFDFEALRAMPDEAAIAALDALPGIGRWTAEVYLMTSLGRADVFAAGDLALQEAARLLFELEKRPAEKPFAEMAQAWSPWRGVAARLLWAYYRAVKTREGMI